MKGQGGPLELVDDYRKIIFGIIVVVLLLVMFIAYINSQQGMGVQLPPLFGG